MARSVRPKDLGNGPGKGDARREATSLNQGLGAIGLFARSSNALHRLVEEDAPERKNRRLDPL